MEAGLKKATRTSIDANASGCPLRGSTHFDCLFPACYFPLIATGVKPPEKGPTWNDNTTARWQPVCAADFN